MEFSIIVPAFNEEDYLGTTLHAVQAASMELSAHSEDVDVELIVVDNNSGDATAAIVRDKGAQVVHEPVQGIARARNTGARHAGGDVLIFVDADVLMTPELLRVIHTALDDPDCIGGGVDVDYRARRLFVGLYSLAWRLLGRLTGMVQGATQFCRKSAFDQVGGYDENVWMGEDVDFYWTLRKLTKRTRSTIRFIRNPPVCPSTRRFDKWPLWKTLLWTNPLFISLFRRRKPMWRSWYSHPVRYVSCYRVSFVIPDTMAKPCLLSAYQYNPS